jgi:catechol 2,3-dioxygenase-like lactoylglutathione lyase family enzyme
METMNHVRAFDHVGITVADLDAAIDFFLGLGLELEGRTELEDPFLDTVCGIPDSRTDVAMLRLPGGGTTLELCTFIRPDVEPGNPNAMATEVGIRNVAFEVDDLHGLVEKLAADGYGLVGGIGEYQGVWRMCYVRGPEGIVVALAQRIDV